MRGALLALLLCCATQDPAALPPAVLPPADVQARMVAMGEVRGFLARPLPRPDEQHRAELVLVDDIDDAVRDSLTAEAGGGVVVLAIVQAQAPAAAAAYLAGMPDVVEVVQRCERLDCSSATQAPGPAAPPTAAAPGTSP